MFKVQNLSKSIDVNKDKYYFHPRNVLSKTLHGSFSGLISSRDNTKRSNENKIFNENSKMNFKENTFYRLKQIPPVYFYRKIQTPYKYNISSVQEYLIKTDEEKHYMDKLNQLMTNEEDRKIFNNLIKKKEKERKFKDRYKPSFLNIPNILKYKPNLYSNSFNFDKRSKSVIPKDNLYFRDNIIEEKEKSENDEKDDNNIIKNEQLKQEENNDIKGDNMNNKGNIKDEISEEEQIKYKYKISDIHNLRNEKVITNKSAEKYLFKEIENKNNNNDFYISSKSQSDWIPNRTMGTKMNSFSSVSYNILSPLHKGFNKFISPTELNKNNLYNESTAFHRVKSISEFIDLTRVSATNTLNCFNRNRKNKLPNFKFRGSVATNQSDEYHINRDIIERPI